MSRFRLTAEVMPLVRVSTSSVTGEALPSTRVDYAFAVFERAQLACKHPQR
jgi:hypothetical protein